MPKVLPKDKCFSSKDLVLRVCESWLRVLRLRASVALYKLSGTVAPRNGPLPEEISFARKFLEEKSELGLQVLYRRSEAERWRSVSENQPWKPSPAAIARRPSHVNFTLGSN
jgi:hypothetical protein